MMESITLEPGWLQRECDRTQAEVAAWPEWLRALARHSPEPTCGDPDWRWLRNCPRETIE